MKEKHPWIYDLLLIAVLAAAAFLRLSGADWGELQHQHPDEGFLTSVVSNLRAHECINPNLEIDQCPQEQQRWIISTRPSPRSTRTIVDMPSLCMARCRCSSSVTRGKFWGRPMQAR